MKTIIISIQVPDGVNVQVSQGNGGTDRPFVQRPDPPDPGGYCPVHEVGWNLIPAGVSKRTNKPYNAFWTCPEMGCDQKPQMGRPSNVIDMTSHAGPTDDLPF